MTRFRLVLAMLTTAALVATLLAWNRLNEARSAADAATRRATATIDQLRTVEKLRSQDEQIAVGQRPAEDALALVNAALTHAGLSRAQLSNLTPESDAALSHNGMKHNGLRKQTIAVTFAPMPLGDFGRLLDAWRTTQHTWTVETIALSHAAGSQNRGAAQPDDHFAITMLISALYFEETVQ